MKTHVVFFCPSFSRIKIFCFLPVTFFISGTQHFDVGHVQCCCEFIYVSLMYLPVGWEAVQKVKKNKKQVKRRSQKANAIVDVGAMVILNMPVAYLDTKYHEGNIGALVIGCRCLRLHNQP